MARSADASSEQGELALARDAVGRAADEAAGKPLVPVRALELEDDPRLAARERLGAPDAPVEADGAAVELVASLVRGEAVLHTVEDEARAGDPVGVAADQAADMGGARLVARERLEAEHDVDGGAAPAGELEAREGGAVLEDGRAEGAGPELPGPDVLPASGPPERRAARRHAPPRAGGRLRDAVPPLRGARDVACSPAPRPHGRANAWRPSASGRSAPTR